MIIPIINIWFCIMYTLSTSSFMQFEDFAPFNTIHRYCNRYNQQKFCFNYEQKFDLNDYWFKGLGPAYWANLQSAIWGYLHGVPTPKTGTSLLFDQIFPKTVLNWSKLCHSLLESVQCGCFNWKEKSRALGNPFTRFWARNKYDQDEYLINKFYIILICNMA